jgi:hypothetical protein
MSSRAADRIARVLAGLNPRSPLFPGKPAKRPKAKRRTGEAPVTTAPPPDVGYRHFLGALSPTRCGASQSQTRSARLDGESPQDLAAALSFSRLTDPFDRSLVVMVAVPSWTLDLEVLHQAARGILLPEIARRRWKVTPERADQIIAGVLDELLAQDACKTCSATGHRIGTNPTTGKAEWQTCATCGGIGRQPASLRSRARRLGLAPSSYETSPARFAYEWFSRACEQRLCEAVEAIQTARGRRVEEEA